MALLTFSRILTACVVAIALQLAFFSPISPGYLDIPPPSSLLPVPSNSKLQEVIKIAEGLVKQPEDIAFDQNGVLYTVTRDSSVKKLHRNGTWEDWWHIDSENLLGITITKAGDLVVCDAEGLYKVSEEGVTLLASHVDGAKIRTLQAQNSLIGNLMCWRQSLTGQLVKYDPSSNKTSIVLDGLGLANGVALSPNKDYLIVCETWKYRCLKYWLEGDNKGQTEIFVDKLPGRPDNINLAPDGSFWIALLELVPFWPRFVYTSPVSRYIIGTFPKKLDLLIGIKKRAMVVNVGSDGKMIRGFDDPTGKVMRFVTSAVEFEGHLYFGSFYNEFVGKLPLTTPSA